MKPSAARLHAVMKDWVSTSRIEIADDVIAACIRHVEWLLDKNRELNLTAVTDLREAIRLHAVDSLLALPHVMSSESGRLVDVGTGGGFPGLPLALATRRETVLLDSVKKKAMALQRYVVTENLESWISVIAARSEAYARENPECAAVVIARAVAELPVLVELASPLLKPRGLFIAMKGDPSSGEMTRGVAAAELCGLEPCATSHYELPEKREKRTIVVFRKSGEAQVVLPRREGMAAKRPLA